MKRLVGLLIIGSLVLAACSGAEDGGSDPTVGVSPGSAMGPGISIKDALTADSGQPLLVNGFLFVEEDGTVTLASLMAESLPPIPGGDQLVVEGLDLGGYQNAGPFPISGRWVWRGGTPSRAPTPRRPVASSRRSRSAMLVISVTITHPPRNNGFESRCYSEPIRAVHTAHQPIG